MVIIGNSRSGQTNSLLNRVCHQPDNNQIYLNAKDPHKPKYQLLINKRQDVDLKHFKDCKVFIEYSSGMKIPIRALNSTIHERKEKY